MSTTLIYIEPGFEADKLSKLLDEFGPKAKLFIPSADHTRTYIKQLSKNRRFSPEVIVPFKTVDADADAWLYRTAMDLSRDFCVRLHASFRTHGGSEPLFEHWQTRSFQILLHDRIVALLRGPFQVASQVLELSSHSGDGRNSRTRTSKVVIAARTPIFEQSLRHVFLKLGCIVRTVGIEPSYEDLERCLSIFRIPPMFKVARPISPKYKRRNSSESVTLITNLRDLQYKLTALPVVAAIAKLGLPVRVQCSNAHDITEELEPLFASASTPLQNVQFVHSGTESTLFLTSGHMAEALSIAMRGWVAGIREQNPGLQPYLLMLKNFAETQIPRAFAQMLLMSDIARDLVRDASCVAVCPGRHLPANLAVDLARLSGIPTVEVQSGTISPTSRFISPGSEDILAIDSYSAHVYSGFLGIPQNHTHVVGSPKIDFDLGPVRNSTRDEVWPRLEPHVSRTERLVVLASQPIGVAKMTDIARIFIEAAIVFPDVGFLIKQHPNETEFYDRAYDELILKAGVSNVTFSRAASVYDAIVAAEIVATYYSTVGLEAHALGRIVVAINPFGDRPPFDLRALGAAREVNNAHGLIAILRCETDDNSSDRSERFPDTVAMLRDGRAAERCAAFVAEKSRAYRLSHRGTSNAAANETQVPFHPHAKHEKAHVAPALAPRRSVRTLPIWQASALFWVADHWVWRLPVLAVLRSKLVKLILRGMRTRTR